MQQCPYVLHYFFNDMKIVSKYNTGSSLLITGCMHSHWSIKRTLEMNVLIDVAVMVVVSYSKSGR